MIASVLAKEAKKHATRVLTLIDRAGKLLRNTFMAFYDTLWVPVADFTGLGFTDNRRWKLFLVNTVTKS